jgi:glutaredoxin
MPRVKRLSDLVEVHAEHAMYYGFGAVFFLGFGGMFLVYRGVTGMFVPLGWILTLIGVFMLVQAVRSVWVVKDVTGVKIGCPYCEAANELLEQPQEDFACVGCARLIPIKDGAVLPVNQVRCGFCNALNYYSEKTEALLCEECNHEIPIAGNDDKPHKTIPKAYMVIDDEALYELKIVGAGQHKHEELIQALQRMLALNRDQVKQMLDELPVTVLTGITRKKAEMLKAQLSLYDAEVEFQTMEEATR